MAIPCVIGTEDDPGPTFAYTVGLTAIGQPELVTYGVPPESAQVFLNDLALQVRAGRRLEAGEIDHRVFRGYPATFIPLGWEAMNEFPLAALTLYGDDAVVTAMQVLCPDRYGRWPWELGSITDPDWLLGPVPARLLDSGDRDSFRR
ncbi:DUF4262 domain-containing protein [Tessaracoccus palaemonis]|uniref:DUF4262 domain-containing protein n=1 Tax=Tessaracoccus palaemonis TaxID=2829499 RepID=A0ABX8SEE0_9ACTN|nr:DUF4262 domain-containing protein [Tessaracoccus palaemonis]QXT61746.1 DUF4262 domain-containing protein [Tessaracoccus palaemonis]